MPAIVSPITAGQYLRPDYCITKTNYTRTDWLLATRAMSLSGTFDSYLKPSTRPVRGKRAPLTNSSMEVPILQRSNEECVRYWQIFGKQ